MPRDFRHNLVSRSFAAARTRRGFTLAELLLALLVTSLIGLTAMTVMAAATRAQKTTQNSAETVQAGRAGLDRVQRLLRNTKLVTAASATELVLWAHDRQNLGYINVDEVIVLRFNAASRTITATQVKFPDSLSQAVRETLNAVLSLSVLAGSTSALSAIGNTVYRSDTILAADVHACTFAVSPDVPLTRAVTVRATFGTGSQRLSLASTTQLRASAVDNLDGDEEDGFILDEPAEDLGDLLLPDLPEILPQVGESAPDDPGTGGDSGGDSGSGNNGNGNGNGNNGNGNNGNGNNGNGNGNGNGHQKDK